MDATALRAMQAPLKDRYKSDPKAAYITLKAKGTLDAASLRAVAAPASIETISACARSERRKKP